MTTLRKAVVLAAGRGTRMREEPQDEPGVPRNAPGASRPAPLDPEQARMASLGLKALIPFDGHAFLEHVLTAVADAGFEAVCLVVRPGDDPVRRHFEAVPTRRLRIEFAVQPEPRGSADALLAAEVFAGTDPVLLINADNFYPAAALGALHDVEGNGLVGFSANALSTGGNISPGRIAEYALVRTDANGWMKDIVEKPDPERSRKMAGASHRASCISMTCWRLGPGIFRACREIAPSVRDEYELPDAALRLSRRPGQAFRVVPSDEPVLDLSRRADVASVGRWLDGRSVRL